MCGKAYAVNCSISGRVCTSQIFLKVDGDENKQLVASKGIKGYPTFHFYLNGNLVDQFSGAQAYVCFQLL